MTALGRFISKLGERALPFFQLMKKKGPFEWTPEADRAFQDLKKYLTSPPMMVAPRPLEPLVLYLAATRTPPAQHWWRFGKSAKPKACRAELRRQPR